MSLFDENAEVLRQIASQGGDFDVPRTIDFAHVFSVRPDADAFAEQAALEGFTLSDAPIYRDDYKVWDVTVSKEMQPTCENITSAEENLDALARKHGGRADGWGFFGL